MNVGAITGAFHSNKEEVLISRVEGGPVKNAVGSRAEMSTRVEAR